MKNLVLFLSVILTVVCGGCGTPEFGVDRGQGAWIREDGRPPVWYQNGQLYSQQPQQPQQIVTQPQVVVTQPAPQVIYQQAPQEPTIIYHEAPAPVQVAPAPRREYRIEIRVCPHGCRESHQHVWSDTRIQLPSQVEPQQEPQVQVQEQVAEVQIVPEQSSLLRGFLSPHRGHALNEPYPVSRLPGKPVTYSELTVSYDGAAGSYRKWYRRDSDVNVEIAQTINGPVVVSQDKRITIDKGESFDRRSSWVAPMYDDYRVLGNYGGGYSSGGGSGYYTGNSHYYTGSGRYYTGR